MRCALFAATAAFAVTGCGSDNSGASEGEGAAARGTYDIDQSTGTTTATVTTDEGTLNIRSGEGVEADLPNGWSLYPGARVIAATNASVADGKSTVVSFESDDSAEEIIAFYREQAAENGIEIEMEMKTGEGRMIAGSKDGGTGLSVIANPQGDKTVTQLSIGANFGN